MIKHDINLEMSKFIGIDVTKLFTIWVKIVWRYLRIIPTLFICLKLSKILNKMSHWSQRLIEAMNDESLVFIKTDELVVIRDKFPKAKHHFLILPTNKNIDNIYDLRKEDIPLINEMELLATNVVEVLGKTMDIFKLGFHAEPSMAR